MTKIIKENKNKALGLFLKKRYEFRYNEVGNYVECSEKGKKAYKQVHELTLLEEVQLDHVDTSEKYLTNKIGSLKFSRRHNPIKEWLRHLPDPQDEDPCPFTALANLVVLANETDEERTRLIEAQRKWFVSAVKCIFDNRFASKQAIVYLGSQGIGKTPFINSYLPPDMQQFIKTNPSLDSGCKDSRIALTSSLIVHFDEVDDYFKNMHNRNNHKSFMTQKIVRERMVYGKVDVTRLRICSFLASCNESTFLNDPTGTERWVVFNVEAFKNRDWMERNGHLNGQAAEDFDINLCWAKAVQLYEAGYNNQYTHDQLRKNEDVNELYKYNSDEFNVIQKHLEPSTMDGEGAVFMNSTDIADYLNDEVGSNFNSRSLGKSLIRLKFKQLAKRIDDKIIRGYYVKKI